MDMIIQKLHQFILPADFLFAVAIRHEFFTVQILLQF